MQRGTGDGFGERRSGSESAPDEVRRTLDRLHVETRALRETLERTARHAHDADPSSSHADEFERCRHPTCRQARAMLEEERAGEAPEPAFPAPVREPLVGDRAPELEGFGGVAEDPGIDRSGDEDLEPSWIPLDRAPTPPPRRPAPSPVTDQGAERPPGEPDEPLRPEPGQPPSRPEPGQPPIQPEPPSRREPPLEPPAPPEPPAAERPAPAPLIAEPGPPSWGPPAIDLPPEAASAEDDAMSAEAEPDATNRQPAAGAEEQSIPSHLFDQPPTRRQRPEDTGAEVAAAEHAGPALAGRDRPPHPAPGTRVPASRDPNIADAAADAIDRLARALFGPKRPRR